MFLIEQKQTNNSIKSFGYSEFSLFNNAQERRQNVVNFKKKLFIDSFTSLVHRFLEG
jgi:hypothetical protein